MALLTALHALLALEAVVSALLISPAGAVQKMGTTACGVFRTNTGNVVAGTIAAVLFVLFCVSAWELRSFGNKVDAIRAMRGQDAAMPVSEARLCLAQQSCVLSGCCLLLMALVRQLAAALVDVDRVRLSLATLKKQAEGMRAEYLRQVDASGTTSAAKDDGADSELKPLRKHNGELIAQLAKMKRMLEEEGKAKAAAEASMDALKKQAEGLEREYDRVCEENNALERKMRSGGGGGGAPAPKWAHGDAKDE